MEARVKQPKRGNHRGGATGCAKTYAHGGYEVLVDGVIGTWYIKPWLDLADVDTAVHYVVLRPGVEVTLSRNDSRDKQVDVDAVAQMCRAFSRLGKYERHALDTENQTPAQTAELVRGLLGDGALRLNAGYSCDARQVYKKISSKALRLSTVDCRSAFYVTM